MSEHKSKALEVKKGEKAKPNFTRHRVGDEIHATVHGKKAEHKVEKVMHEFKEGKLHSGSKKGPEVRGKKQAIAIALSEARKAKK